MNRKPLTLACLALAAAAAAALAGDHASRSEKGDHDHAMRMHHHMMAAHASLLGADADDDGAVDAAEWTNLFTKLDADRNGKIDREEMHSPQPEMLAFVLMHDADGDGDGKVTAAEWDARVAKLDADGDGSLTHEEIHVRMRLRHPDAKERAESGLPPFATRWDADKNGKLDASELDALFKAADQDGDGALVAHHRGHRDH